MSRCEFAHHHLLRPKALVATFHFRALARKNHFFQSARCAQKASRSPQKALREWQTRCRAYVGAFGREPRRMREEHKRCRSPPVRPRMRFAESVARNMSIHPSHDVFQSTRRPTRIGRRPPPITRRPTRNNLRPQRTITRCEASYASADACWLSRLRNPPVISPFFLPIEQPARLVGRALRVGRRKLTW